MPSSSLAKISWTVSRDVPVGCDPKKTAKTPPNYFILIVFSSETPGKVALFNEIASHLHDKLQGSGEPDQKRRKVQAASTNGSSAPAVGNAAHEQVLLEVKEISVSVPQRKKFELCFTENFLYARAPGTKAPIDSMIYPWSQIGR